MNPRITFTRYCNLYTHRQDPRRLLYVCERSRFPGAAFAASDWQLLASGVEPPRSARRSLRSQSYFHTRLPAET